MNPRRTIPLFLILLVSILLVACSNDNDTADNGESEPPGTVATVNGAAITESDVDAQYQAMTARGQSATRGQALDEVIELMLLTQEAENQHMHEQSDIAAEIRRQRMGTLANHLLRAELDRFEPDEAEIEAIWERRYGDAAGRTEYHARHILLETREDATDMISALADGADFAELAREYSIGPSGPRGGDLDWFRADTVVEPFGNAVQSMEPGQYSDEPVETQFGWHVILLEDTRESDPPTLEEVRSELENELLGEFINDFISTLRADGSIEIRDTANSN